MNKLTKNFTDVLRMYHLAVHDAEGKQYFPIFGYRNEVMAYAPAAQAIAHFRHVRNKEEHVVH